MKIIFKIIKANSGSDVYFERLSRGLNNLGLETKIVYFNKWFQFLPFLVPFFDKDHEEADIIHSNLEYGWVFKRKDIPLVLTAHHNVIDGGYQKFTSLIQKLFHYLILKPNIKKSLKTADKIIAVSNFTKISFVKTFKISKKIEVIYNGIDLDVFKPLKVKKYNQDKKFHLIFVGNLIKRKGADLLPKIMKKLGDKYVLHYTSGLRTKPPKRFNLDNMIPLGKLSLKDLVKEYNKCDALLFPTRLEGFGYAAVEAMACGKTVITTNCSSLPELIMDQKNGFLCKLGNIDDFVEKIEYLTKNKKLIINMGIKNRKMVVNLFSVNKWIDQFIKIYNNYVYSRNSRQNNN